MNLLIKYFKTANPVLLTILVISIAFGIIIFNSVKIQEYDNQVKLSEDSLNKNNPGSTLIYLKSIIEELQTPKIFIGNTPLIADIFINETYKSGNFNHIPKYSYITADKQVHKYSQGSILRIKMFFPQKLSNIEVEISNSNDVYSGTAFKIDEQDNPYFWYAFIGLNCTIEPGIYKFTGKGFYLSGDAIQMTGEIEIIKKDFPSEKIYFDKKLTTLLTEPDPKQTEERRYLRSLINLINPESIYEKDKFILPLTGYPRSTTFGDRCTYIYSDGSDYLSVHRGIDFAAPAGTLIVSMGKGKVILAGNRILTGFTVVIEHLPGVYSIYYHMSELLVKEGDIVKAGDPIGKVGSTGLSTGPHLHLALYVSGQYVDPEYFVLNKPLMIE